MTPFTSTTVTTGTICNSGAVVEPTTCTLNAPLIATGNSTCASVPVVLTKNGFNPPIATTPVLSSITLYTRSVLKLSPLPCTVITCPAFAEAFVRSAAVPLNAVLTSCVTPTLKGALVPPAVVTVTAPKSSSLYASVFTLARVFVLNTSGPVVGPASSTVTVLNRYCVPLPSMNPLPLSVKFA